ncbi:MAG: hypothetical protein M0006_14770 [Magnetospirillum sp.]|nr:hypothetical protein [Magnetospirillum sp.]
MILTTTLSGNLIAAIVLVVPLWRVFGRAGLNPALSVLIFLPLIGFLVVLFLLALMRWPTTEGTP